MFSNPVCNILGEVGGAVLGEELKVNTVLTSINLADNDIRDAVAAIGEALKVNTHLTFIDLNHNASAKLLDLRLARRQKLK